MAPNSSSAPTPHAPNVTEGVRLEYGQSVGGGTSGRQDNERCRWMNRNADGAG